MIQRSAKSPKTRSLATKSGREPGSTLRWAMIAAPVSFVVLFFAWPLAAIIVRGVTGSAWRRMDVEGRFVRIIWFTTWQAAVSALATVVLGLAPAYVLARRRFPGRRALLTAVTVPFVLPTVVSAAAFVTLLPTSWNRTTGALILAHVWVNLALVVRGVGSAWAQLDPDLGEAAATLGAEPSQVLRHITLPLLRPAIISAGALTFLFCFTSFGLARLIGGPAHPTIEVEIWRQATQNFDLPKATLLTVIQLVLVALILFRWTRVRPVPVRYRQIPLPRPGRWDKAVVAATAVVGLAPLVALVIRSVHPGDKWSLKAWRALTRVPKASTAAKLVDRPIVTLSASLRTAVLAGGLAVALGTMAALAIVRWGTGGRWADTGLTLPLGASAVSVGLGLLITFDHGWYDLRSSWILVPLGQAVVALPVVLRIVLPALRAIPPDLRHAAGVLGASPLRVAAMIDLGLTRRAVGAAAGFAVAISLGEFGATSLLTRTDAPTAPIAIGRLLGRPAPFNLSLASALAVALGGLVVVIIAVVDRWREAQGSAF